MDDHNRAVKIDQQYKKRQSRFLSRIDKVIQLYNEKLEFTDKALHFQQEFPSVKGYNQWPKLSDISNFSLDQFKEHRVTHLEFYDLVKHNPDAAYAKRISFRLYTEKGEKSPVSGYHAWVNNPEGYNSYLTKVDLAQLTKIDVVVNTQVRNAVCWIVFYY